MYWATHLRHQAGNAKLLQLGAGIYVEGSIGPLDIQRACQRALQVRQGWLPVAHGLQMRLLEAYVDLDWRLEQTLPQGQVGERQIKRQTHVQRHGFTVSLIQTSCTL